uniref:Sulfotransferase domain-containing protein n=1 Tax=Meloidogyne incognita TaxID=6306 RepID=A0A914MK20_MELIC
MAIPNFYNNGQKHLPTFVDINLPNFLIIGVRKGGTRALLDALALHPKIKIARHEVHFFDKEKNFRRGLDWYSKQMPKACPDDVIIEKTPAYFTANPQVPQRVFQFNPKIKFILIVRSPITRTVSDFTQILQTKKERNKPPINFEKMSFIKNCNGSLQLNKRFKPIRNSLYAEHLKRWLNYFPLKQFLIIDGDKFIEDPLSQAC